MKKKSSRKPWSKKEDDRLLELLSENTGNFTEAYRQFHREYPKRTVAAIGVRWYKVLRYRNDIHICMMLNKRFEEEKSLWQRIKERIKRFFVND